MRRVLDARSGRLTELRAAVHAIRTSVRVLAGREHGQGGWKRRSRRIQLGRECLQGGGRSLDLIGSKLHLGGDPRAVRHGHDLVDLRAGAVPVVHHACSEGLGVHAQVSCDEGLEDEAERLQVGE